MQLNTMRTLLSATLLALVMATTLHGQTNIEFVGRLSYQDSHNSDLANLWGYTDEAGNEYAIMGVNGNINGDPGGVSIVDLSDPTDPVEIFFYPGPTSIWRELKVWNDHAYMTTEANNGGITIVDLSPLPQSTALTATVFHDPNWETSHALFIDENGRLFIFGAESGNGGAIMYDLTQDPMSPVQVGTFDQWYIHDGYARGDTLYAGHIENGFFSIVDVSDPTAPVLLGTRNTPNNFTHNVWLDASGDHLFTTDERTNAYVGSYDVSEPSDIQFLDKLQSDPGSGAIPHNTYWMPSGHVVQSYYTYGVTIYDVSRPDNMVEVGHYDTSPTTGGGFFGAWGVYPYLPSGRLIISDIEEGLFVLDPTYVRACWLEGSVRDAVSNAPIQLANVSIAGTNAFDVTGFEGLYGTGHAQAGTVQVAVTAPGYYPTTVGGVILATGEVTLLDILLDPLPSYLVAGLVRSADSGTPVEGVRISLVSGVYDFNTTTNADGTFSFPVVYSGTYAVTLGRWGWHTGCPNHLLVGDADITGLEYELEQGYADDFAMDLNWQVITTAARGGWVRGTPQGTTFQGVPSNPGSDVPGDCREQAYVTGNAGGNAATDDVDEGGTLLISPEFDATGMADPHVRFFHWFFNGGGQPPANDSYAFSMSNGADSVVIRSVNATNAPMSQWVFNNIRIQDHLVPTATMRFMAYTEDLPGTGHLVEAALDDFSIVPNATTSVPSAERSSGLLVWPNPATSGCTIVVADGSPSWVELFDVVGRQVVTAQRAMNGRSELSLELPPGTYMIRVRTDDGRSFVHPLLIQR